MPWWPEDQWRRMVSGEDCPMCADVHLESNAHSDLVLATDTTYTRLHRNQTHAGYCVVILNRHVCELHHLPASELQRFWRDVTATSRAIAEFFEPVKLNTLIMGHLCPHLHCHVFPQYASDDPLAPTNIQDGSTFLEAEARQLRIQDIRDRITLTD